MGVINLLAGPYIIVVRSRRLVGHILENPVFHIEGVEILSCAISSASSLTAAQLSDERQYLSLLKGFLQSGGFYYSPRYDLTSTLQAHHKSHQFSTFLTTSQTVNNLFVANGALLGRLLSAIEAFPESRLEDFVSICIYGFVSIQKNCIADYGSDMDLILISRRSTGRVGTRYHSRGIDDHGHVSNFVETEQIVMSGDRMASLLQCRGSIPLYWRQTVDMRYSPVIELYNYEQNEEIMKRHLGHLKERYSSPIVIVNLINQRGSEAVLGKALEMHLKNLSAQDDVRYVPWDFHEHCRSLKWHNVSLLMEALEGDLAKIGWFEVLKPSLSAPYTVSNLQEGIVRTNCIDCLDRTNVVQSIIAKRMIASVLARWGQLAGSSLSPTLTNVLNNIWADNADAVSRQYSGTGALKTDFTRTGNRTYRGTFWDLYHSVARYLYNNFSDAARQDAMDLFFGRFTVVATSSPFSIASGSVNKGLFLVTLLVGTIIGFLYTRSISRHPVVALLALIVLYCAISWILRRYGMWLVRLPRLQPPPISVTRAHPSVSQRRPLPDPHNKMHII